MARDTIHQFTPVQIGASRGQTRMRSIDPQGSGGTVVHERPDVQMEEIAPGVLLHQPPSGSVVRDARTQTAVKALGPADPAILEAARLERSDLKGQESLNLEPDTAPSTSGQEPVYTKKEPLRSGESFAPLLKDPAPLGTSPKATELEPKTILDTRGPEATSGGLETPQDGATRVVK